MGRKEVIADLNTAWELVPEVPPRWMPKFLTQWRDGKARNILTELLNDPTPTPKIKGSITRALHAESRHVRRTELAVAIFQATSAYLMDVGKTVPQR